MNFRNAILFLVLGVTGSFFSGCGYSWQGRSNPHASAGIRKVYIRSLVNNTLKPGVEVLFTSAVIKEFARGRRVVLVGIESEADAVIEGAVDKIESQPASQTTVASLARDPNSKEFVEAQSFGDYLIASEYSTAATISVKLVRVKNQGLKDSTFIWGQSFSDSKIYPANNRFGPLGATSSLINSSQEQYALNDIAQRLASDVYGAMFEAF